MTKIHFPKTFLLLAASKYHLKIIHSVSWLWNNIYYIVLELINIFAKYLFKTTLKKHYIIIYWNAEATSVTGTLILNK